MKRLITLWLIASLGIAHAAEQPPEVIKQVPPIYPPWLVGPEKTQGEVLVSFVVTKEGKTVEVTATRSVHPLFSQAAVAAVKQWTFRPGRRDGVPMNTRMQVPIVFTIDGFLGELYLSGQLECLNRADGGELPVLVGTASPKYPGKYWRANVDGAVTADFTVTSAGKTSDVKIVSASHPEFADSIAKAVGAFRFAMDPTYVGTPRIRMQVDFMSAATQTKKREAESNGVPAQK